MKYELALGNSPDEMEAVVNSMIEDGFKPIGGVSFAKNGHAVQAMIKE